VWIRGYAGGQSINLLVDAVYINNNEIEATVGPGLAAQMAIDGPVLDGLLRVTRTASLDGSSSWQEIPINLRLTSNLEPVLSAIPSVPWYPGDTIYLSGDNFLLPGEGETSLLLEGSFSAYSPPTTEPITVNIPVVATNRNTLSFVLNPDLIGIKPGELSGTLQVQNTNLAGDVKAHATPAPFLVNLERPYIEAVNPTSASRGQQIEFQGRGFLPTSANDNATSLILLEGIFETSQGESISLIEENAIALFPDEFMDNTNMAYVLRAYLNIDGKLDGLGVNAGVFTGNIRPWVLHENDTVLGSGISVSLTIEPQRQIVYLKFLPGYYDALEEYGLGHVEPLIRTRIFEVLHRDYVGVNITFMDSRPEDFVEYSVVEVGGVDPNDANLFGLDNTQGKDVGNIRFNDIIGGVNAETEEEGYYAYGGIFVESFLALSPTLGIGDLPITDIRFDQIFGPFIPGLGGSPVEPGEHPGGVRSVQIAEAIRVLSNLVGGTITHEVGHSLGLANIEGQFHNIGDNPAAIMDAGIYRPFGERAEIDGEGPAVFTPLNSHYLELILPIE